MATTENNGLLIYKDENGDLFVTYPITKAELVDGLDEEIADHADRVDNPHSVTAAQVEAIPTSEKGAAGGVATLNAECTVTEEQLPATMQPDNVLSDATAELYDLGADAVPDDVFGVLSRLHSGLGNEYLWRKSVSSEAIVLDNASTTSNIPYGMGASFYMEYADEAKIVDGVFTLVNPSTANFPMDTSTAQNLAKLLPNKYIKEVLTDTGEVLLQGFCVASESDSSSLEIEYKIATVGEKVEVVGYVNSPDPNAYPVDDGSTYAALGQLGNKVQIAIASYTGTNTYGLANPCSISFDFVPTIVISAYYHSSNNTTYVRGDGSGTGYWICYPKFMPTDDFGYGCGFGTSSGLYILGKVSDDMKTISWYSEQSAANQLNTGNTEYYFIAIG